MQASGNDILLALRPMAATVADPRWLDAGEKLRLAEIMAPLRRQQLLASHCLARELASAATGLSPTDWRWQPDAEQRRMLVHASGKHVFVSVSHSGGWLAAAIGGQPLGVDVEADPRPRHWAELAHRLFHPALAGTVGGDAARFRRAWALTEAWAKRSGRGIQRGELRECGVEAAGAETAEAWSWCLPGQGALALAAWPGARVRLEAPPSPAEAWRYGRGG